ncbi:putative amino acid transporter protein [Botryosphaeria dothidea]|uniref:Amino acid transporter protein n=1 Tax=Botryosphaeria dothidea TaxID=55169 RepID=A0A8H4J6R8_9PEZI|nr:putative amino acid transporter protein [Botryosphaeria dothidea]
MAEPQVTEKNNIPVEEATGDGSWGDTANDVRDMQRLGKKQEFKRNFGFLATLGFVSIYMATWEFVLVSLSAGFINGGFAGLFWTFIGTVTCYATIVASLAEMESMAPTSGGQYHWCSEFASPKYQKFLSYSAGWMSTLGWLASFASSCFVCATLIEICAEVISPDFGFTNWQYTLIMLALIIITIGFNTVGAGSLPMLETASLFAHILGFFIIMIICWAMCRPLNSGKEVFTEFVNSGGWSNMGTACLISQVTVMYCNLGSDSIVHISEEVEDASWIVPRAMWWSYVINVFLGIVMLITMLFGIGSLEATLEADAPYLNLFNNTGSTGVSLFMTILLLFLIFAGNITTLATVSRELWAFSRDKGFPCSSWISHMNRKYDIPFNAVYLSSVGAGILCLVNLGSTLAFNIIVSLSLLALLSTYMLSIGCVLLRRIRGQELPHARWSLGKLGLPINAFAFCYSFFVIVFSCFPTALPVTTADANWAPAIWAAVIVLSIVTYLVHGKQHFTPPVMFVEGKRAAGVGIQASS